MVFGVLPENSFESQEECEIRNAALMSNACPCVVWVKVWNWKTAEMVKVHMGNRVYLVLSDSYPRKLRGVVSPGFSPPVKRCSLRGNGNYNAALATVGLMQGSFPSSKNGAERLPC